ncbi:putative receptor-like protein kinase [Canna indica]|uniref:non-specific serine/threonine protein kinase n=1 Tax=Canna indica TaxID=4628 RepID=A0AAQ3JVK1_9LILI|nr:putative receptor-like protein kinase [Canna indica]
MKCFHFPGAGAGDGFDDAESRVSRLSWTRSLSATSTSSSFGLELRRAEPDPWWELRHPVPRPPESLRAFAFAELKAATRGFSRSLLIGEGGFGCVYRGVVTVVGDDGAAETIDVAVKQLNRQGFQGHKEWITEVNFLGVVKHPNLVKLVGYCAEDDERGIQRLLVYELMRNKSLEDHLLSRLTSALSWTLRLKIAYDAARGLAYLHEEMDFQLIFRDFKTSNILLDEHFNAKLSDFGFARHGPAAGVGHVSTSVVGTVGYVAPEYVHTGKLTSKSDVWSFGVVLYELLTGRRSVDRNLPRSEQSLLEWVKPFATDHKKLFAIVDPRLEGNYCLESAQRLVALANRCLKKQPKSRPRMSEVVDMLDQIIKMSSDGETPEAITSSSRSSGDDIADTTKLPNDKGSSRSRVFEIKDMLSVKNRSVKLYWRSLSAGPISRMANTWT